MPELIEISGFGPGLHKGLGKDLMMKELISISGVGRHLIPGDATADFKTTNLVSHMRKVFKKGLSQASDILAYSIALNQRKDWMASALEAVEAAAVAGFNFNRDPKTAANLILISMVTAAVSADRRIAALENTMKTVKRLSRGKKGSRIGRLAKFALLCKKGR